MLRKMIRKKLSRRADIVKLLEFFTLSRRLWLEKMNNEWKDTEI